MTRKQRNRIRKANERRHQAQFGRQWISGTKKEGNLVLGKQTNISPRQGRKLDTVSRGYNKLLKAFTPYKSDLSVDPSLLERGDES